MYEIYNSSNKDLKGKCSLSARKIIFIKGDRIFANNVNLELSTLFDY
jgi:hypothetical protein